MQSWVGKKPVAVDNEFGAFLRSKEEKNKLKQQKQNKKAAIPNFFQAFVDNTSEPEIDYNFECGCYGSIHPIINNCTSCGRIICKREGERPCPFCGSLVFSDETLNDPELLEEKEKEMETKIGAMHWIPTEKRDLAISHQAQEIPTSMIDLDKDWFDSELAQIFEENIQ